MGTRITGLDTHRAFAEAVAWDDGKLRRLGRVGMRRNLPTAFKGAIEGRRRGHRGHRQRRRGGRGPCPAREEGRGREPQAGARLAQAKIKTDTIDAGVLARLYASGFLPEVGRPDAATQALRRQDAPATPSPGATRLSGSDHG